MSDTRNDLPSTSATNFEQRVRETLMTYMGKLGNPLDKGITMRDLLSSGIGTLKNGNLVPSNDGGGGGGGGGGGDTVTDGEAVVKDYTPPPTPTGFKVLAGSTNVFIEHDDPQFTVGHGYLRTAVYGKVRAKNAAAPVFADAVKVAEFSGAVYAFPADFATTWHLWIKWQTNDGVLSSAPAGGINGLEATTGQDVSKLIELLETSITASQLHNSLAARINKIDGPATMLGSVASLVMAEAVARKNKDDDLVRTVAQISASTDSNAAAIVEEKEVRTTALKAEAFLRTSLASEVRNNNVTTTAVITDLSRTVSDGDEALAQQVTTLSAKTSADLHAAILTESTVRANADFAQALRTTTLQAEVDGVRTSVQEEAETRVTKDGELFAQYTVKIDNNGYVSGFGLASTGAVGTAATSAFAVRADKFYIANPEGPGIAPSMPFIVQTTPTVINGQDVPAGVYISNAFIKNGQITNAKIGNAAIDNAKVANLSASKLSVGDGTVGGNLKSVNYGSNRGWMIERSGNATFNNATVRGTIYADSGTIGNLHISSGTISSAGAPTPQIALPITEQIAPPIFKAVCASFSHTMFLSNENEVYVSGYFNGWAADVNTSTPTRRSDLLGVSKMISGLGFSAFMDTFGFVSVSGWVANDSDARTDILMSQVIKDISAGGDFFVLLDAEGDVFLCERKTTKHFESLCPEAQIFSTSANCDVRRIDITNVKAVYAGWDHLLMLKNDDTLWACGAGVFARGLPIHEYKTETVRLKDAWKVPNLVAAEVASAAAGRNATWYVSKNYSVFCIDSLHPPVLLTPMTADYDPAVHANPYKHYRYLDAVPLADRINPPVVTASIFPHTTFAFIQTFTFPKRTYVADFSTPQKAAASFDSTEIEGGKRVVTHPNIVSFSIGGWVEPSAFALQVAGSVLACGNNKAGQLGTDAAKIETAPTADVARLATTLNRTVYYDDPDAPFGGTGFNLKSDGTFMFGNYNGNNLTFNGTTMKYRGSLDVKSSTNPNSSRMEITDTCIKVYENGALRVQIGDLSL